MGAGLLGFGFEAFPHEAAQVDQGRSRVQWSTTRGMLHKFRSTEEIYRNPSIGSERSLKTQVISMRLSSGSMSLQQP